MRLSNHKIVALVPISDGDRAKSFYVDKLGLKFLSDDGFAIVLDADGNIGVAKLDHPQRIKHIY